MPAMCPTVESKMIPQTPDMLTMVLADLEAQERELAEDPVRSQVYNGPRYAAIVDALQKRKAIFQLLLNLLPDEPRLRMEIVADALGAMVVMAGVQCEHGSCYLYQELAQSIAIWSARMPLLTTLAVGEDEGEKPN